MSRSVIHPLRVELDVLHRLRLSKQNHLLDDVHLIVGIDGLVKLPIIWESEDERNKTSDLQGIQFAVWGGRGEGIYS